MENQEHLQKATEILYIMELFEKVPIGEEGNTILQFNRLNPKDFLKINKILLVTCFMLLVKLQEKV